MKSLKKQKKVNFRFTLLALTLASGFAYAETQSQNLEAVQVRAQNVPSDRRVTLKRLDETTATQLKDVLSNEPSISFNGGNGTSQYIFIRGMGENSVDIKLDNAYSDSQILYHQSRQILDPALVKIVAVQKGAGSASAGIGQTNGAIIAKTIDAKDLLKNSTNPNFGAKVDLGYNSNKGHNYGLSVFGKNDAFDFLLSGNRVNDSNYKAGKGYVGGLGNQEAPYTALDKTSYLAKIGTNVNNHRFVLSHLKTQHEGTRLVREEFFFDPANTPNSRLTIDRQVPTPRKMSVTKTDLEWTAKDLGFAKSATANIYRLQNARWSADDSKNGYAGGDKNSGSTQTKINTVGANVNFDSQITDNVLLKYGLNYRNQEVKPNQLFNSSLTYQEKRDVGVYAEAISDINDKLTLTTGLRYDRFTFKAMDGKKRSSGAINPSISATYQVTPQFSVNAMHNYATRSPRTHDALMAHGGRAIVSIGDNTKAEQARNTEIGFKFDNGSFGLEGSYFWQNIKDALGTTTGRNNHLCAAPTRGRSNECYSEIINAGKIKNKGYELSASYRYDNLTARLGVADSKPRFYGENLSNNPEYAAAIGRTWTASLAYRFANPNLELGLRHRQVEKVKPEDNFFKTGMIRPETGKDGYGVTDITANWKPLNNDKMNVNFAVNNVANKLYRPHAQRGNMVGEGRQFKVGVNYTF